MTTTDKCAAVVTIHGAGRMTAKGRRAIIAWLRHQARMLRQHGAQYSTGRFTARYLYR